MPIPFQRNTYKKISEIFQKLHHGHAANEIRRRDDAMRKRTVKAKVKQKISSHGSRTKVPKLMRILNIKLCNF